MDLIGLLILGAALRYPDLPREQALERVRADMERIVAANRERFEAEHAAEIARLAP